MLLITHVTPHVSFDCGMMADYLNSGNIFVVQCKQTMTSLKNGLPCGNIAQSWWEKKGILTVVKTNLTA